MLEAVIRLKGSAVDGGVTIKCLEAIDMKITALWSFVSKCCL